MERIGCWMERDWGEPGPAASLLMGNGTLPNTGKPGCLWQPGPPAQCRKGGS